MYTYRIYVHRGFGYELEDVTKNELDIDKYIQKPHKDFSKMLVIRHDNQRNIDIPYTLKCFDDVPVSHMKRVRKKNQRTQGGGKRC